MNVDRELVAQAVLAGQIGPEHLTYDEVEELEWRACDAAMNRAMDEAEARGLFVFGGFEGNPVH